MSNVACTRFIVRFFNVALRGLRDSACPPPTWHGDADLLGSGRCWPSSARFPRDPSQIGISRTQPEPGAVSCSPWLFNGEAWFLSVPVVFWLFLRPLAEFFPRRSLRFSAATLLFCWLFSFAFQVLGRQNRLAGWLGCDGDKWCECTLMVAMRATPIGYVRVFVAGVASARVFMLVATRDAETGERVGPGTRGVVLAKQRAPLLLRYGCCVGGTSPTSRWCSSPPSGSTPTTTSSTTAA